MIPHPIVNIYSGLVLYIWNAKKLINLGPELIHLDNIKTF